MIIDGGAAYATGASVVLTFTAPADTADVLVSNSPIADCGTATGYVAFAPSRSWTLTTGDATKTVHACLRDAAGNTSPVQDEIILDTTDPTGGSVAIDGGAAYATNTPVTLTITADADVTHMAVGNGALDCATATYEPFASVRSWVLTAGDATKTVTVCFRDAARRTGSASDTIVLDTTVPAGSITLDAGAAVTDTLTVAVDLGYASDTAGYALANGALDCGVATYTAATGTSLSTTWSLPSGDGVKTVVACFRDSAGNTASYATTITLDQTAPAGSLTIDAGATYATALGVQLGVSAPSDTASMTFSNTAIADCDAATGWQAFAPSRAWTLAAGDGTKTVHGCLRDAAGNTFAVQDEIVLDTTNPTGGSVSIDGGATYTTSTPVTLSIVGDADVTFMAVGNGALDCATATYEPFASVRSWVLTAGDATKTVTVCFRDAARRTGSASDTIVLDTTVPAGSITLDAGAAVTDTLTVAVDLGYASDTAGYALANGALDCGVATYTATTGTSTSTTWSLPAGDGVKTVVVCFEDQAGNAASYATTITLDQTAPAGALSIDDGAAYTDGVAVQLGVTAPGDTARMTFSNTAIADCDAATGWQAFAPSRAWTLTTGDGTKIVYGCLEDAAGNTAAILDQIVLDTAAPAGTVTLQGDHAGYTLAGSGAGYSFSTAIQALLSAPTDTLEVALGDGPTLDCNTATYQAYAGVIPRTLPAGDGSKDISVCFKDAAGNTASTSAAIKLDTVPPTAGLSLASGASYTTSPTVSVALTFLDDTSGYALAESSLDCAGATYTPVSVGLTSASTSFTFSAGDGTKTVVACVREAAGRVASTSSTIVLDTVLPTGTVTIDDGATYATSTTASLRFVVPADTLRMSIANAATLDCATATYVGFSSPFTWSLSAGDGLKTVTVCFEDAAGNRDSASDTITLDTANPTGSMTINAGATHTQTTSVVLDFTAAADVTGLAVREAATLDCATAAYQPYTPSMAFTLSASAGSKNLVACFQDAAGRTGTTSASIILDASSPSGTITLAGGAAYTTGTTVAVALTFPNDTTGYALGDGVIDCDAATYTPVTVGNTSASTTHSLPGGDGTKTVSACFTDAATNTAWSADTIILDTAPPSGTVAIDLGATYNTTGTSSLTFSAPSDTTEMAVVNGATINCGTATYQGFASPLAWPLPGGDGTKTVSVCFKDAAGLTASAQDAIVLDTTDPAGSLAIQGDTSGYTLVAPAAGYTFSPSVSLALSAPPDTTSLAIANGATINCGAAAYQPFASLVAHTLPGADGSKSVSVCFKDAAGRTSSTTDSITLDTAPPTGSVSLDAGGTYTADLSVAVGLSFLADTNGYALAENSIDCASATYTAVTVGNTSASTSFTISGGDGMKTVVACIREAGGRAAMAQDTILLDASAPAGSLSIDNGAIYDIDGSVTLTFIAPADTADLAVVDGTAINCGTATYQAFVSSLPWTLPGGDGTKTVSVCYRDGAGNAASTSDSIILDTSSPTTGTVSIAAGATYTTGAVVSLDLTAPADVAEVAIANGSLDCGTASYGAFTTPRTWVLSAGDGGKTVTACFRDAAGRTGSASDTITLDTLAPSGIVTLAGGNTYATGTPLAVSLSFPNDTAGYALAEGSLDCAAATYTSVTLGDTAASTTFPPSIGDGVKTVVACFLDAAGNRSSAVDTVTLDTSPPAGAVAIDAGATFATSTGVTLNLAAPSDTTLMAVRETATIDCSDGTLVWEAFATTKGLTLGGQGTRTVSVCFEDAAGLRASAMDSIVVDSVAPTGSVLINNGASHTQATSVTLDITAAADVIALAVADGGSILCSSATYEPFSAARAWTLPAGEGSKTVSVCLKDAAGNTASVSDAITLDSTAPTTASLTIDAGAAYTTASNAQVTLTFSTPETVTVAYGNESIDCAGATYGAFASPVNNHPLQDQDGVRTVVACFKDAAGWIVSKSDSIILDRTPPAGTVAINGGTTYATSTGVTLNLSAPGDANQMAVRETTSIDCADGTLVWEAFATTKGITLGGQGTRTVSVCFKDAAGLTASTSDAIIVDSVAPTGSVAIDNGASHTQTAAVVLDITADGDVTAIAVADGGSLVCTSATYEPFSAARAWTLPVGEGSKTVSVCLKDAAGNSVRVTDSITVDTVPPSTATLQIDGGAAYTTLTTAQVTLTLTTPETVTVAIGNESIDCASATYGAFAGTVNNWPLQDQDGVRTVVACFKDAAGWIVSKSDDIILDRAAPTVGLTIDGGALYTTDDLVDLAITASGDVSQMSVKLGLPIIDCGTASYVPFTPSVASFDLDPTDSNPDGWKYVSVCVEDGSGQQTKAYRSIYLDRTNPTGTLVLANGASHTNERNVSAQIPAYSTDVTQMAVAEGSIDCASASYSSFNNNFQFILSDSDTLHTVLVCLKDRSGRTAQISDTITLDRSAPGGALSINAGATWSTVLSVTATITSADAAFYAYAAETIDCTAATYQAFSSPETPTLDLVDSDGTRSVVACLKDTAGNIATVSDTINLDTTPPVIISFTRDELYSQDDSNDFTLTASDNLSLSQMRYAQYSSGAGGVWEAFATDKTWDVNGASANTSGIYYTYAWVRDAAGNVSTSRYAYTYTDYHDPSITSFTVTDSAGTTLSGGTADDTLVVIKTTVLEQYFGCNSYCQMRIGENPTLAGVAWQSYDSNANYILSAANGPKTIYVQVQDRSGRVSTIESQTLDLDTQAPTVVSLEATNPVDIYTNSTSVTVDITADDNLSVGTDLVAAVGIYGTGFTCSNGTYSYPFPGSCTAPPCTLSHTTTIPPTLGGKYVLACVEDAAGNRSASYRYAYVYYDNVVPSQVTGLYLSPGSRQMTVSWATATDANSGVDHYQVQYSTSSAFAGATTINVETPTALIEGLDNLVPYYVHVRAVDKAGNYGAWSGDESTVLGIGVSAVGPEEYDRAGERPTLLYDEGILWVFAKTRYYPTTNADDRQAFRIGRCEAATLDCKKPANWTWFTEYPGYRYISSERPSVVATQDAILVASTQEDITSGNVGQYIMYCRKTSDCASTSGWGTMQLAAPDALNRDGSLSLAMTTTHVVAAALVDDATDVLRIWSCELGSTDCTTATDWSATPIDITNPIAGPVSLAPAMVADERYVWIIHPQATLTGCPLSCLANATLRVTRCDTRTASATSACATRTTNNIATASAYFMDMDATIADGTIYVTYRTLEARKAGVNDQEMRRCALSSTGGCSAGADWSSAGIWASNVRYPGGETGTLDLEGAPGQLHLTLWDPDTQSIEYQVCENPSSTNCTIPGNWSAFPVQNYQTTYSAPSLEVYGTNIGLTWLNPDDHFTVALPRVPSPHEDASVGGGLAELRAGWTPNLEVAGNTVVYAPGATTNWQSQINITDPYQSMTSVPLTAGSSYTAALRSYSALGEPSSDSRPFLFRPLADQGPDQTLPDSAAYVTRWSSYGGGRIVQAYTENYNVVVEWCAPSTSNCAISTNWTRTVAIGTVTNVTRFDVETDGTYIFVVGSDFGDGWVSRCSWSSACNADSDWTTEYHFSTNLTYPRISMGAGKLWVFYMNLAAVGGQTAYDLSLAFCDYATCNSTWYNVPVTTGISGLVYGFDVDASDPRIGLVYEDSNDNIYYDYCLAGAGTCAFYGATLIATAPAMVRHSLRLEVDDDANHLNRSAVTAAWGGELHLLTCPFEPFQCNDGTSRWNHLTLGRAATKEQENNSEVTFGPGESYFVFNTVRDQIVLNRCDDDCFLMSNWSSQAVYDAAGLQEPFENYSNSAVDPATGRFYIGNTTPSGTTDFVLRLLGDGLYEPQ
ncbi:MAG: fibronectin type III domain-containing protein [Deltaproteobacteria bacterium]|nr:fibronectin type III domain-containing protein [Deltaproteobacteria bacterium]